MPGQRRSLSGALSESAIQLESIGNRLKLKDKHFLTIFGRLFPFSR